MSLPSTYKALHLAVRPQGEVTSDTFKIETHETPSPSSLEPGQVLLEVKYISCDPAMRTWLDEGRSYIPPVQIGAVMLASCVGVIKASQSDRFKEGDLALGLPGCVEYAVMSDKELEKIDLPPSGKMTDIIGLLGITGLTAYFGIINIGQVKAGDFVVISGAAGAVGSVVGQIAKLKGARVLGIAGTDDKVRWLKEDLGFDDALNYKDTDFAKKFEAATEGYIDVFFDNVGGEILDMALDRAKIFSRFVMCGSISDYNTKSRGLKNQLMIVKMRVRMQGFIVLDFPDEYEKARRDLNQWLAEGKVKTRDTILKGGVESVIDGMRNLFTGANTGKMMIEIKTPPAN